MVIINKILLVEQKNGSIVQKMETNLLLFFLFCYKLIAIVVPLSVTLKVGTEPPTVWHSRFKSIVN